MASVPPLVCFIGKSPLGPGNGASSYLRSLARAAGRAGFVPHVFCTGARTETVASDIGLIHVVGVPWPRRRVPADAEAPVLAPWLLPALERFGASVSGPLIIHGVSLWGWIGLLAARRLRRRGVAAVPLVSAFDVKAEQAAASVRGVLAGSRAHRHGLIAAGLWWHVERLWERHGVWPLERQAYRHSRLVLVNYAHLGRLLVHAFGSGVPVRRVPYTPESAFVHPAQPPGLRGPAPADLEGLGDPRAPLLVTVSRHDVHKGLDVLLEALAVLRARDIPFRACLLGAGTLLAHHQKMAARLGLGRLTTFPGYVDDAYVYLRHADVFVLPSRGECGSGSLALLEAMQAGAAIISSACDGIPEDVTSGLDALLVPPGRIEALADALTLLLTDAGLRLRLATAAQVTFRERFSADGLVQALGHTYAEVIDPA